MINMPFFWGGGENVKNGRKGKLREINLKGSKGEIEVSALKIKTSHLNTLRTNRQMDIKSEPLIEQFGN